MVRNILLCVLLVDEEVRSQIYTVLSISVWYCNILSSALTILATISVSLENSYTIEIEVDCKTGICLKLSVMGDVFHSVSIPVQLRRKGMEDGKTEPLVSAFSVCGKHDP